MSEPKIMSLPELDACLNTPVIVYESTSEGIAKLLVKPLTIQYPCQMDVRYGEYIDGVWLDSPRGTFLTFAGANTGITKIEKDGSIIYENEKIPVPYIPFDAITDEGLEAMNELRQECFGDGSAYRKVELPHTL